MSIYLLHAALIGHDQNTAVSLDSSRHGKSSTCAEGGRRHSGSNVHHLPTHSSPTTDTCAHRKEGRKHKTQAQNGPRRRPQRAWCHFSKLSVNRVRFPPVASQFKYFSTPFPLGHQPHVWRYKITTLHTTLTCVSRGWLYDGATRFQKAISLCLLNHPHRNTVLDWPTSIEILTFCHCL